MYLVLPEYVSGHYPQSCSLQLGVAQVQDHCTDSALVGLFLGRSAFQHAAVFLGVMYVQDFFFLFLMIYTSLYMVSVLFSHRKIALCVHSASLLLSSLPETKAAHVILLLLSCCFFFYGANLCFTIYMFFYKKNLRLKMESITSFLASCYSMVCALMLIKYDNRVSRYACVFSNMINFPLLTTGISLASKKY
uniref:Vomeronasal type-1 receptor n=1 Tax=Suricata suricatta TaxID=37032 RepID=A0A673UDX9_SURSU